MCFSLFHIVPTSPKDNNMRQSSEGDMFSCVRLNQVQCPVYEGSERSLAKLVTPLSFGMVL